MLGWRREGRLPVQREVDAEMNQEKEGARPGDEAKGRLAPGDLPRADQVLDAVGLFCPLPIMRTAERVRRMNPPQVLEVRADDPVTLIDLPNWCAGFGHQYIGWTREGEELRLFLQVRVDRRRRPGSMGDENGS